MARVKQWNFQQQLSYLLFDPISRRCALIDPLESLEEQYLEVIERKGLVLAWRLATRNELFDPAAEGQSLTPPQACRWQQLALGELEIRVICDSNQSRVAYLCDGLLFSGEWWLAGGLRPSVASRPDSDVDKLPLLQLPEETLLFPGRVAGRLSISSIAQEKFLLQDSNPVWVGGHHD
ncbi:hypothetical protein [Oceanobacter mangrovi]|uniref:hypothetical protein n=1 Tax=Oceanobacter mangrovi TaxID=2862510 RepID=UPI001C8E72D0|nr:hypothetical protein [Oceanobacter mangrovi]